MGLADTFLDEALEHPVLAEQFPTLQSTVDIDERALARLHRALASGRADITSYYNLAYGRVTDGVPGPQFRDLVVAISRKSGGAPVGLEMVSMRLHADASAKRQTLPEVREAGRIVLESFEIHRKNGRTDREDHELRVVAKAALAGPEGIPVTRRLCRSLMESVSRREINGYDHDDLMAGLLMVHPQEVLDELFPNDAETCKASVRLLQGFLRFQKSVMDAVPDDVILSWCDCKPQLRYPLAASVVLLFKRSGQNEPHEWTPLAGKLLQRAPDPRLVLNEIVQRLHPMSWSGSLATKLEGRLRLLNKLPGSDAPHLAATMTQARVKLQKHIDAELRREQEEDRAQNNRFE